MWEGVEGFFSSLDPLSLILGGVVGAIFSTWMTFYVTRPVLKLVGSSGGGGPSYKCSAARIMNVSGFIGIRIRETVIFGWSVHNQFESGLSLDRQPARQCQATLFDKKSSSVAAPLFWRLAKNPNEYLSVVDIGPNEQVDLMLFCGTGNQPKKYFPFRPKNKNCNDPIIPEEDAQIEGTNEFYVEIRCQGRKMMRFDVRMEKRMDGRLYMHYGSKGRGGGGTF